MSVMVNGGRTYILMLIARKKVYPSLVRLLEPALEMLLFLSRHLAYAQLLWTNYAPATEPTIPLSCSATSFDCAFTFRCEGYVVVL